MAAASEKLPWFWALSKVVFCGGMSSRSITEDVLARCFIDDLFRFMGFHDENFVNDRIISLPAFRSLIATLKVAAYPEHDRPRPSVRATPPVRTTKE